MRGEVNSAIVNFIDEVFESAEVLSVEVRDESR